MSNKSESLELTDITYNEKLLKICMIYAERCSIAAVLATKTYLVSFVGM